MKILTIATAILTMIAITVGCNNKDSLIFNLTITTSDGGAAIAAPAGQIEAGTKVTLTATPEYGHTFEKWIVVSGSASIDDIHATSATFVMPRQAVEIRAEFGGLSLSAIFPDPAFRGWVAGKFDDDNDGIISPTELTAIAAYKTIAFPLDHVTTIADLTGIDYFTALMTLDCSNNQLTKLNLSANTALVHLNCDTNKLIELNLSANTALTHLYCGNNLLTALGLSTNTSLTNLDFSNNRLTQIDLSKNSALIYLYCNDNRLTSIDPSANTLLTYFHCDNNQLTGLNLLPNTSLISLSCSGNKLAQLVLSVNTALTNLYCSGNQLTALELLTNTALRIIACNNNKLANLNLTTCTDLKSLACGYGAANPLQVTVAAGSTTGTLSVEAHSGTNSSVMNSFGIGNTLNGVTVIVAP